MPIATILIVEDDQAIRRGLADCVRFAGYAPHEASDGQAGLDMALALDADLVLLDVLMPKLTGFQVLKRLRESKPRLPVIMLTAKGEEQDKVQGLKLGADDYVVKPFSASELIARIEAVLRRSAERPSAVKQLAIDGRLIDFERREVRLAGGDVASLSEKEAGVLQYLSMNRGRAISREELLRCVWGLDPRGMQTRTVDMAVARIREALRDDADAPCVVVTVRGKGYMLAGGHDAAKESQE
jgi:two-component system, OmpR family, alkaline phosphatase synthesis response regulator PhoP